MHKLSLTFAFWAGLVAATPADTPSSPVTPSSQELASAIRSLLLSNLPEPLVQHQQNWGKQVEAITGSKKANHGAWRKVRVTALNPTKTLNIEVRNLQQPEAQRTLFDLNVDFDSQVDFEQQLWERGLRVYSGSTRARAKVHVTLQCEVVTRIEVTKGILPDLLFRLRVLKARLSYSGLDFVHIAGMGGTAADVLGHSLHTCLKSAKPTLEKDLLTKANAAIVKAGDSKEVRVSLSKLLLKR